MSKQKVKIKTKTKKDTQSYFDTYINEISDSDGFRVLCDLIFTSKDIYDIIDNIEKNNIIITSEDVDILYKKILDNPYNNIPSIYKRKVEYLLDMFFSDLKYEEKNINGKNIIVWYK